MNDNTWIHLQQIIDSRCTERINLAMQHMLDHTDNMNIQHTGLTVVPVKDIYKELTELRAGLVSDLLEDLA